MKPRDNQLVACVFLIGVTLLFPPGAAFAQTGGQYHVVGDLQVSGNATIASNLSPGSITLGNQVRTNWPVGFSGSFNDLSNVPAGLSDGDDDSKWDGGATGLDAALGRVSLGLGSAATHDAAAFAPADLSSYAGSNLTYSNGQLHAGAGYSDVQAVSAVAAAWPDMDTTASDDLHVSGGTLGGNLDMGGTNRVTNLAAPAADGDALRKSFLRSVLSCLPPQGDLSMGMYTNGAVGSPPLTF